MPQRLDEANFEDVNTMLNRNSNSRIYKTVQLQGREAPSMIKDINLKQYLDEQIKYPKQNTGHTSIAQKPGTAAAG